MSFKSAHAHRIKHHSRRGGPAVPKDGGQGCGIGANALFDVTRELQAARLKQWIALDLPLACLAQRGADLSRVSAPLALTTDGHFEMTMSEIRYVQSYAGKSCPRVALEHWATYFADIAPGPLNFTARPLSSS